MRKSVRFAAAALVALQLVPRAGAAQPAPAPTPAPQPPQPQPQPQPPDAAGQPAPPAPAPDGAAKSPPPPPPVEPSKSPAPAPPAAADTTPAVSKLKVTIYGFVQVDLAYNTTQSCLDFCSNFPIQKSGTYKGDHARTIYSARDSRFGVKLAAPDAGKIKTTGTLEMDFFGPTTTTEQGTWVNPVLRFRHAYLKFETPIVDVLIGQTWNLFGWSAGYLVTSVQEPGLPGQMFQRTPQVRLTKALKLGGDATLELAAAALRPPQQDSGTPEGAAGARLLLGSWTGLHTVYMSGQSIQPASIGVSADVRRFRIPELATAPKRAHSRVGGGVAFDAYLPIVTAKKTAKDNALSVIGELVIGRGTSDMYTALGAAGTVNAAVPPANPGDPPGTYTPNFDAGFAAYDANGNLELIKWTSYMAGVEYYPPGADGRIGVFANYGHMKSSNSSKFGGAAVMDPVAGKTRANESFYNAGVFFDPTKATRIGVDGGLYDDHYVDGTKAKNYSLMSSAFLFF
ncbi:MAG TPA: hypothetical protein VN253_07030 [Kofleriaceae bacterium]|nr:hypothetical protein [Kofleriaceae bacterium]